jgi:phage repressor protein C with HTH and peptisase S24 domain
MIYQHKKILKSFCAVFFQAWRNSGTTTARNSAMSDSYDEKTPAAQKESEESFLTDGIDTISARLDELRGDLSYKAFAESVGISESGMRKYFPPYLSMPTLDKALRIARTYGVNLEWLATGEGPKHPGGKAEQPAPCVCKDEFDEEYALIEGYHITVSTGHGAFNGDEIPVKRHLAFRWKWLKFRGFRPERLKVVFAKGDSMEPNIKSGDSLLINLDSTRPIDGEIFVVRLGDELYAKRIQKRWDGAIELISDNKEYNTQVIPATELEHLAIVGQVVWIGKDVG